MAQFLARLLEIFLFVALVVWFSRKIAEWRAWFRKGYSQPRRESPAEAKPLYRDPWCGTYVSTEISRKLRQHDQTLHFCSDECLARYVASQRQAAQA